MRTAISFVSLSGILALAACEPRIPDSGVGFDDYNSNAAQFLQTNPIEAGVISDENVASTSLSIAIEQAVSQTPAVAGTVVYDESNPNRPRSVAFDGIQSTSSISDEQDFNAVAARESIESDAQRLAENRLQYQEIAPSELPARTADDGGVSVVRYALGTSNAVGVQIYARGGSRSVARYQKACAKFASSNAAQEAFLNSGGPQKDRKGLDPDGDGFACSWDPTPFRAARGG